MTRDREELIRSLASEATPVERPGRVAHRTLVGWSAGFGFAVVAMLAIAPMRPGAFDQLATHGRFAFETLLGLFAGFATWHAALRLSIPGPAPTLHRVALPVALLAVWVGFYVFGLHSPALEPSMLGKRHNCHLEVVLLGLPSLALGLVLLRRGAVIARAPAAALIGAAAGAIPGLLMQLGCMYEPGHILAFHVAPIAVVAALGAVLGPLVLRRL